MAFGISEKIVCGLAMANKWSVAAALPPQEMGTVLGKPLADCATSALSCAAGEPQEMCSYGGGAPGHRPGQPCDWGNLSSLCTSQLASCECSAPTGVEGSALARYTERPLDAAFVYAGPVMLWTLTLAVQAPGPNPDPNPNPKPTGSPNPDQMWPLYKHLTGWSRTFRPPRAVTTTVSRRAVVAWVALCVGATAALLLAALLLPAAVWGQCTQTGVCVYHMMIRAMSKTRPMWPARAAQLTDWPKLAVKLRAAWGMVWR